MRQNIWSHGTSLGSIGSLSQGDLGLGSGRLQFLVIWGPYELPILKVSHGTPKSLKSALSRCVSVEKSMFSHLLVDSDEGRDWLWLLPSLGQLALPIWHCYARRIFLHHPRSWYFLPSQRKCSHNFAQGKFCKSYDHLTHLISESIFYKWSISVHLFV